VLFQFLSDTQVTDPNTLTTLHTHVQLAKLEDVRPPTVEDYMQPTL